jgi:dTDP-4-dehydrorhamnose 3,5-epimerase
VKVSKTKLDGVLQIHLDVFEDHRGTYIETYNEYLYREHGIDLKFVQDDISSSHHLVLRGIHGDNATWKLITCLYGRFYLVVVNCDERSSQFGQWQSFTLSDENHTQILVPPKYGNAHLVLSERTIFHYKQTTYYDPDLQFTYKWDDPLFNIWWPIKYPILSQRDEQGHFIK